MRIGILGGTFDPVHYGHLLLAETCREQLQLDQVRFIPAGQPPHKLDQLVTDGHVRADMLRLAISGYPEFVVDRREIRREGPSFTVETLTELAGEFPAAELFFLMGADSLRDVSTWRQPQQICQLATVVACNRPGVASPSALQVQEWVGPDLAARVKVISIPGTDLSSSEMRSRIRSGAGLRFMTPRAVEVFIQQHHLYAAAIPSAH